jgi:hypothetical protein
MTVVTYTHVQCSAWSDTKKVNRCSAYPHMFMPPSKGHVLNHVCLLQTHTRARANIHTRATVGSCTQGSSLGKLGQSHGIVVKRPICVYQAQVCIHTYMHTCMHSYIHANRYAFIHTRKHWSFGCLQMTVTSKFGCWSWWIYVNLYIYTCVCVCVCVQWECFHAAV